MNLLDVEDRVLDQFLARVDPADADGMRRHPPIETMETLSEQWKDEPAKRPTIEREIVDLAHTLGW